MLYWFAVVVVVFSLFFAPMTVENGPGRGMFIKVWPAANFDLSDFTFNYHSL